MEIDSDDISASRCHHVEYVIRFIKMIEELRDKGDIESKNRKIGRVDYIGVFLGIPPFNDVARFFSPRHPKYLSPADRLRNRQ